MKQNIIILGSTGSIGINTLEVISYNQENFNIFALVANTSFKKLYEQCKKFKPKFAYINKEDDAKKLIDLINSENLSTEVIFGREKLNELVSHDEIDIVVCAISGSAGLESSINAVNSGKKILLANKESLVMCGNLFMDLAKKNNAEILPLDSEHNALHQCFAANGDKALEKIILTASGGPFLNNQVQDFNDFTPEQALKHPTWSMGKKISIDSATMMNKGLEIIEAMYLFDLKISQVDALIHPQSLIHSLVCYSDGSVITQVSKNDMKIPISYCLGWPNRIKSGIDIINLTKQEPLTFFEISKEKFPCFFLAKEVAKESGSYPTAMNAANEVAVKYFLDKIIKFNDIYKIISDVMDIHKKTTLISIDDVFEVDKESRNLAETIVKKYK
jgi:1-deoxy-D-xylulose-5-phosphate reductoisomerase